MAVLTWNWRILTYTIKTRYLNVYTGFALGVGACILVALFQRHILNVIERENLAQDSLFPNTPAYPLAELLAAPDAIELDSPAQLLPTDFTATGYNRERDSTVTARHLCLNAIHGLFRLVDPKQADEITPIPEASIVTAGDSFFHYMQPATIPINQFDEEQRVYERNGYPNHLILLNRTTFFLMETYFPSHYSHFLVNNAIPLLEVLGWHYSSSKPEGKDRLDYNTNLSWMSERRHLYIRDGMHQKEHSTILDGYKFKHVYRNSASTIPIGTTVCYDTAVLGLNSTCPVGGCLKVPNPSIGTYTALRRLVRQHFLSGNLVETLEKSDAAATQSKQLANGKRPRVVVVQRRGTRSFTNLDDIQKLLRDLDVEYKVVELENYSMQQQVEMFSQTDVLIAVHGNAIGNLFWLPPNAVIVEIWQYGWESHWFKYISDQLIKERNIKHEILSCSQPECAPVNERDSSFDAKNRATIAPLDKLRTLLISHGVKLKQ